MSTCKWKSIIVAVLFVVATAEDLGGQVTKNVESAERSQAIPSIESFRGGDVTIDNVTIDNVTSESAISGEEFFGSHVVECGPGVGCWPTPEWNDQLSRECPVMERPRRRNWALKTNGGRQFWTDIQHFHGYRLQRNAYSHRHRLLDSNDVRLAWGTEERCQDQLQGIALREGLQPVQGKVLIILHGLGRTRGAMEPLAEYIQAHSDMTVLNVSYASTRLTIEDHADGLRSIIDRLPEVDEFYFVAHSLGNIIVRRWLGDEMSQADCSTLDPRFRRMVMLGPPNQGSGLARCLQDRVVFKLIAGRSAQQLSRYWAEMEPTLATPPFEFGIIAGYLENGHRLLVGRNDRVVQVEETRLPGASDYREMSLLHTTMMIEPDVLSKVLTFLQEGYFVSPETMQPMIP